MAAVLANPALLFTLPGAGFEVVASGAGVPVGARGRVLGLWSNAEALWVDLEVMPTRGIVAPPGSRVRAKAVRECLALPLFLRVTCGVSA